MKTIFLLFLTLSLSALSLEEAISTALLNSTDLKKVSLNIDLASKDIVEKKSANFGHLDALASYNHYNLPRTLTPLTPASMSSGASLIPTTKDLFGVGVAYSVELFNGMQDTRSIEISSLQKEMARSSKVLNKEQIIFNVKTLYVNILALQAQRDAQLSYIEALKKLHKDIVLKVKLESLAKIDELKSSADLQRAAASLMEIDANIKILKSSLASVMLVDTITELEKLEIEVVEIIGSDELYQKALLETNRLKLATLEVQKNQKQEDKTFGAYYPKIGLNGYYGQNFGVNDRTNAKSGDFNHAENWQVGLDLKWNIFDFGKKSSMAQKSQIVTLQSKLEKLKITREQQHRLTEALTKIELAIKSFKSASTELDLMDETQKIEQIRYDNGASDINDLLYTKSRYQLAYAHYINAKYSYQNATNYLNYILERGNQK